MGHLDEIASEQFSRWERQGRGWRVWPTPVTPEPPFRPFPGFALPPPSPHTDDGRKPRVLASLFDKLHRHLNPAPPTATETEDAEEDVVEPDCFERTSLTELQIALPKAFDSPRHGFEQFLQTVSVCRSPLSFELLGSSERIITQLVIDPEDAPLVREQMEAVFPDTVIIPSENALTSAWHGCGDGEAAIVEFGLAREFAFPLAACKRDPFVGILAALQDLASGEVGLLQVLFEPVRHAWGKDVVRALTDDEGKAVFQNAPDLLKAAEQKAPKTLYAAVVRIATRAAEFDRAWDIARNLAAALRVYSHPTGNELIPLHNEEYPFDAHEEDLLRRQTRRSGMILTIDELLGFVHLPSSEVRTPKLVRQAVRTKAAPASVRSTTGLLLGHNSHAGRTVEIRLSPDQRVRHAHLTGVHGTGKSTLLFNLISQDISNGQGVAVLDPHGDLIDRVLGSIPENRIRDVILFDAADEEYSIPFNILSAHSDLEKNLLASDLVSVFQRLSTSWGDQMASVLRNAVLAFLESSQGGTLDDIRRFLLDARFRKEFLETVRDPAIVFYWQRAFPQLTGNKSIGPVLTRLDEFLAPKTIRYMVSQRVNRLDFAQIMDEGKIFLARLPQGQIGKENAFLLGSLLVTKFQQTTMSRQAQAVAQRNDFWLYVDEFQNFVTPSMTEILTGARKYRLGLVLAHQELRQLDRDRELASAVSHCCTRVVFRVGDDDARKLADGFSSFEAQDLQNLNVGEAICRIERSDHDFNLSIPLPPAEDAATASARRQQIVTASRATYSRLRSEVEAALRERLTSRPESEPVRPTKPKASAKQAGSAQPISPKSEPPPQAPPAPALPKTPSPSPASDMPKPPQPAKDLGRGGAQHKAIQQRLKEAAEHVGFRSTIEKSVLDGQGSVDLLLERDDVAIAVEITVSTTIDHEVGNVAKCLKAGYLNIVVVSTDEKRLQDIEKAVTGSLGQEAALQVQYFSPDAFLEHLQTLSIPPKRSAESQPTESTVHGYTVRRHTPPLTPEEQKQRESAAIAMLAEAMRKPPS